MNYSESGDYLKYGACMARDDLEGAKSALQKCLDDPRLNSDPIKHSDLLRRMGELQFDFGHKAEALWYFRAAEEADPQSLLMKLYFARFLARKMGDKEAAISHCELILSIARQRPFPKSEDDFGSDEYAYQAEELKQTLMRDEP